jgi:hypothetical protein
VTDEQQILADIKTVKMAADFLPDHAVKAARERLWLVQVWDTHRIADCMEKLFEQSR